MKRKIAFMVFVVMLFSAFAAPNVFAAVNDMGVVYYTDIRATVNGQFIPYISVSVNGNSGVGTVAITDLTNYGFDIAVDNNAKTATLTFNANKTVTPLPVVEVTGKSGNVAYRYFSTDWKVFVAGVRVDSYNVGSRLSIKFGDLAAYGTYDWNGTTRVSSFTTNVNSIPQPPTKFSVSGKIIDQATGLAISGASVSLYANGSVVPTQTTSNANGDYVIGNVNASSTCYVQVTSPGYADAKSASFAVNAANVTGMNVTMQRASNTTVIGYVGDQANNAIIRNATVIIKNSAGTQIGSATTDSTGYYTVAGIPAGVCSFTASASGYASNTVTSTVSGSTFRQDIKLTSSGYSINGTLNAGNTGLGNNLSNIQVALYKDSVSSSNFVTSVYTTDRNGTFQFTGLQNGTYYAVVTGAQIGLSSDSRSAAIVINNANANATITLGSSGGYSINGTINAGTTGLANLSNIQVSLYQNSVANSNFVTSVYTTDRNGTFQFTNLQNGVYYTVVSGSQYGYSGDSRSSAITINNANATATITLNATASGNNSVSGTVYVPSGIIVDMSSVTATAYDASTNQQASDTVSVSFPYAGSNTKVSSNTFTVPLYSFNGSRYVYVVISYKYKTSSSSSYTSATAQSAIAGVVANQGYASDVGVISLNVSGYQVAGIVSNIPSGRTATIYLMGNGITTMTARVASNGTFSIAGVPNGYYTLQAFLDNSNNLISTMPVALDVNNADSLYNRLSF